MPITESLKLIRLTPHDCDIAASLFALLADVFAESSTPLSDTYIQKLLSRNEFWAIAAVDGEMVVGGITAHTLFMTSTEDSELFVYDLAVAPHCQRQGIGRALINELRALAAATGVTVAFVPANSDDVDALRFYRALGGVESGVRFFTFGE